MHSNQRDVNSITSQISVSWEGKPFKNSHNLNVAAVMAFHSAFFPSISITVVLRSADLVIMAARFLHGLTYW